MIYSYQSSQKMHFVFQINYDLASRLRPTQQIRGEAIGLSKSGTEPGYLSRQAVSSWYE